MAKQLNVDLRFTANNAQAKQQIQDLQTALDKLMTTSGKSSSGLGITKDIAQATSEVAKLQAMLESSKNASGGLDLGKFNQSLAQGQVKISDYAKTLSSLGPQGDQAFAKLAKAIVNAEVPLKRTNSVLKEFKTSLANTARWQLSSSMLHGFMGAVQSAYGYAQDLNESLNNIRIVTGQNTDQMAQFAKQANKAAQALSTTTTQYTDASLIYYQQGLSDAEVSKRTEVTIKMANAAGQSAQIVSDQLTAVWNNFYDGSKSLEYYADVMTALGAATASSTDEIAGGLEKFAAIGQTIGLSYEYAASALATITSNTRQSEEVVGTALKTIFARIQGLNLGETLDDGTSLNKYSEALQKVGISIFEQNGEIKKMDNILDEMAAKWGTLAKDQQIALAQTVAGVRQYTQLIALMDNWNAGDADSMTANLNTAYNATGTLTEQADIYAESWEAAQKRVTAAAEEIYNQLLNDKFFIELNNGFAGFLNIVSDTIDSLGGLPGVLSVASTLMFKMFGKDMAKAIDDWGYNIKLRSKEGVEAIKKDRADTIQALKETMVNNVDTGPVNAATKASADSSVVLADALLLKREELVAKGQTLSQLDELQIQNLQKINDALGEEVVKTGELLEKTRLETKELESQARLKINRASGKSEKDKTDLKNTLSEAKQLQTEFAALESVVNKFEGNSFTTEELTQELNYLRDAAASAGMDVDKFDSIIDKISAENMTADDALALVAKEMDNIGTSAYNLIEGVEAGKGLRAELEKIGMSKENIDKLIDSWTKQGIVTADLAEKLRGVKVQGDKAAEAINNMKAPPPSLGSTFITLAQTISSLTMAFNNLKGIWDTWNNDDMSFGEKLLSTFTSLGMVLPTLITSMKALSQARVKDSIITALNAAAEHKLAKAKKKTELANKAAKKSQQEETQAQVTDIAVNEAQAKSEQKLSGAKGKKAPTGKTSGGSGTSTGGAEKTALTSGGASIAASLIIIAAGLAILGTTIALVVHQMNAAERAVEKAKNAANELKTSYDNIKSAQDEFNNQVDAYNNAQNAVSNLTRGTEEYAEAIRTANDAAMELLETNQNLSYEIKDGQVVINEDSIKQQQKVAQQNLEYAQAARMAGQAELARANEDLQKRDMARALKSDADKSQKGQNALWGSILGGIGTGLVAGGTAGLIAGSVGGPAALITGAIGAAVGAIAGATTAIIQETSTDVENEALEKLESAYLDDSSILQKIKDGSMTDAEWDAIGIEDEALRASLQANADEVSALVQEMAANTAAVNAQNDLVAANALSDNKVVQDSKYRDQIIDIAGDAYGIAYDKALKSDWVDTWGKDGINKAHGANQEAKKVFAEYLKYAGLEGQGYTLTDTTGTDKNRQFVYTDKEGNEHKVSLEAMQAARAAYEASNTLNESAAQLAQTFTALANSANDADQALLSFVSGKNFEGATNAQFQDMMSEVGTINYDSATGRYDTAGVQKYIEDALGQTLTDEVAAKYGYESADAMLQAFAKKLSEAQEAWDNLKIPNGLKLENQLTLGSAKKIQDTYEEMGQVGGKAFVDTFNTVTESKGWDNLNLDEQTDLINELANIDWSSWDAGERAIEIAESYGVAIDGTTEAWKRNVDAMRDATNALPDLNALRDTLSQVKEISDNIDLGQILSEEDYNLLVKYNKELEGYFAILSDGSAQFVGDVLDFQQAVAETGRQKLIEAKQAYLDRNEEILAQEAAGLEALHGHDINNYTHSQNFVGDDGNNYFKSSNVNTQLDFLESQGYDSAKLSEWKLDLEDGSTTVATLEAIGEAVNETASDFNDLGYEAEENQKLIAGLMNEIALGAESAEERAQLLKDGIIDENAMNYAAMAAHNQEKWEDLDPKEVETYAKSLRGAAKASDLLSDELAENEEAAEDVALYTKKMNKGIEALSEGFEGWSDVLKKSDSASEEYADAMNGIKTAMSDVLGVSEEFISDQFILDHMEDIKLAAEGDAEAIDRLAIAAAKDILVNIELQDEGVREELYALHDQLAAEIPDIEVGATLDDGDFLSKAAQVVETAGMTVDQANAYFRALGFEPHFETKEEKVTTMKPKTRTHTDYALSSSSVAYDLGPFGKGSFSIPTFDAITTSWNEGYTPIEETVQIPALTTDGGQPNFTLTRTNSGAMNNSSSSNKGSSSPSKGGGGGGSKSNKEEKLNTKTVSKRSDYGERYHTINKQIESLSREMEKASKSADKLWSRKRLAYLDEQNAKLDEELELLRQKNEEAQGYLETDLADLEATSQDLGIKVDIGEDGEILNFDDIVDTYARDMMNLETAYNNATTEAGQEQIQEQIDALQEKIDAFEDAKDRYYDTLDVMNENEERRQEIIDQQMQNNFDKWSGELELDIEINERDLELLEYYLSKTEDNVYAMAEAAALMVGALHELGSGNVGGQMGEFFDNLSIYNTKLEELNQKLAKGEITEAAYEEGLEEIRAGLMDNLSSIQELDKAMLNYYGDTLSAVSEEMDKYTAKMEHQTSVLEHYSNMMDILGKSKDYESMGSILQGQAETLENELAVAEAEYNLYAEEAEKKRKLYEEAVASGDAAAAELYKNEWEAAEEAAMEAQSNMLDKTEQWAEAMKAVVENKLAGLAQTLEQSLTGGSSFEQINTQLERAASLQEEYLTTTNQIYETNKLMRTAQQEIDKSTNLVAKQRLKDFIKETDQLQNKSKLSKYELDIQKAKYDLLLAELALEDAQNAKSTVRLQRDSEGNFGYVYTADQSQLAQAQQQLEDAQNSLYNIGLEGANSYTEKYNQTMQEMYDTLTSITQAYYNGEITSHEEYEEQMLAAQEYYYEQLENFQDLYGVALQTDTRVIADAWSTGMGVMKIETRTWKDAVTTYTGEATATLVNWYNTVDSIAQKTGLDNIASKVKAVTDESKALKEAILGNGEDKGVIGALTEELQAVSDLTGGYANLRTTIQGLISDYEELLESVVNAQNAQEPQGSGNGGSSGSGGDSGSNGNNGGSNNGGNNSGGGNSGGNGGTGGSGSGNGGSGSGQSSLSVGKTVTVKSSATHFTRDGGNGTKMKPFVPGSDYEVISIDGEEVCIGRNNQITGWVKKTDLVGFKTGGYTGSWGPYGKLGILDEKELILNQGDTANFLASMEVLERILEIIDLQAMNNQLGGRLSTPGIVHDTTTQTLEQSVHIEASFPGVQDRFEIEEAFNTLVNKASQYANRK